MSGLDNFGEGLFFATLIAPLIVIPVVYRLTSGSRALKIAIGLMVATLVSAFLFFISMAILFRQGMKVGY